MLWAIVKEAAMLAKEIGSAVALEMLKSIRRRKDPKLAAELIIKEELMERSYRP